MSTWEGVFPAAAGGGGGGAPYVSGRFYPVSFNTQFQVSTGAEPNRDYLIPFVARTDVTVDAVSWVRSNATAGNVYVGIYDMSGNLLTDCAVGAVATAGLHSTPTTPVAITGGVTYYMAFNQSAQVVAATTSQVFTDFQYLVGILATGFAADSIVTFPTSLVAMVSGGMYKARTNAALSNSLTMTGFENWGYTAATMGIIPA